MCVCVCVHLALARREPNDSTPALVVRGKMLRAGFSRISGALSTAHLISGGGERELDAHEKALGKSRALGVEGEPDDVTMSAESEFDFERMVASFEAVTFPSKPKTLRTRGGLPHTDGFLEAMREVILLFDHLGSAFAFVRRDIQSKTSILRTYAKERPSRFGDLQSAVNSEVAEGVAAAKPPPSAARTLLRLMWALKFIDVLLSHLKNAMASDSDMPPAQRTLRAAVSTAYEQALAEHHSWALRRTVRAALALLPTMETFVAKVGVTPAHLQRLETSMTPIVRAMYRFYSKHDLLNLP